MKLLKKLTLANDHVELKQFEQLTNPSFIKQQEAEYAKYMPARNAKNKLSRGVRWGMLAREKIAWLDRPYYFLSAKLNPEEGGAIREMDLISESFLRQPEIESMLMELFTTWQFKETSFERAYEIQLSAIRYEVSASVSAFPSPVAPHQDLIDGAIVLMNKTDGIVGGITRVFDLDEQPLYEVDLQPSQALLIEDNKVKHQVSPISLGEVDAQFSGPEFRDILIVRFQPLGR